MSKSDDQEPSGRRAFFRSSLESLRGAVVEAAKAMRDVSDEIQEAVEEALPQAPVDVEGRRFFRNRERGPSEPQKDAPLVRPPGAPVTEDLFLERCNRCHRCVAACPAEAIFTAGPQWGARLEATPLLHLDQKACILCEDVPCASSCPTGALRPISVSEIKLGVVRLSSDACLNSQGQECSTCVEVCVGVADAITKGRDGLPVIDEAACVGCGQCVVSCPSYPKALRIDGL